MQKLNSWSMRIIVGLLLIPLLSPLTAQRTLNPVKSTMDDLEGILKAPKSKITTITLQSETSVGIDVSCEYEGFVDKKYSLKAEILNKLKQPLKEIAPVIVDLNSRAESVDFNLQFKPMTNQTYQTNVIESAFLKLTVTEVGGSELDKLLGESLNNRSFLFECKKEWSIKTIANNNTVLEIKLIPLSSVSKMKPSN